MILRGSAYRIRRFSPVRLLPLLMLVALGRAAWLIWHPPPPPPPPTPECTVAYARSLAPHVKAFARAERLRAWSTSELPARQAAWLAAKAEHLLHRTRIDAGGDPVTDQDRKDVLATWPRLIRARHLSCLGHPRIPETGGARLRAYVSPVDCSLQTYSVNPPPEYDADVPWPLIVHLHGHGWYRPYQGHPAAGYAGAIGVAPHGRGATDYKGIGEIDVLRVIDEVCLDFNVDRDRIVVTGGSMGGTGSWHLGVHYADRFAAIQPIAGNADYRAWSLRWGWNAPFPGRFDALRDYIQEGHTARAFAVNLTNLPAYVLHGSADTIVPAQHARGTVDALRRLGITVEYREFPHVGHGGFPGWASAEALAWACGYTRAQWPRHIRWKADRMRHGRAYWITMVQKRERCQPATVDAVVDDQNRVRITTANLLAFHITRDEALFDPLRPLFVTVDGHRVIFPPARVAQTVCSLRLDPARGWFDARRVAQAHRPVMTAALEGPIQDVLLSPFVVVVGTASPDPLMRRLWLREGHWFASEWKRRNLAPCPVIRDVDCTEALMAERHLICLGGPDDNTVSARIAPALPVDRVLAQIPESSAPDANELPFAVPAQTPATPDVGFFLLHPNPLAPQRLAVLVAANGPESAYQVWGRFGNWFNWGVYDSKKYFDYAVFDARTASPETFLVLGFFGTDWSLENGACYTGVPECRAAMGRQGFPLHEAVPADVTVFDLAGLRPASIDHMRGAVAFDRDFHGRPLPRSLGIRAPCNLDYELDGTVTTLSTGVALLNSPENTMVPHRERGEKVRFTIKGDGRVRAAATVSWSHPFAHLEADIAGVKTLRLEAHPAGGPSWLHAGAAWVAPRLYRRGPKEPGDTP